MRPIELAVTFAHASNEENIKMNADIIIAGLEGFASSQRRTFSVDQLASLATSCAKAGKTLWVDATALVHEPMLATLESALRALEGVAFGRLLFADPAVYEKAPKSLQDRLHFHAPILTCNAEDIDVWHRLGCVGATLSNELTLEEMTRISKETSCPLSLIGHGAVAMMHSRRRLVTAAFAGSGRDFERPGDVRIREAVRDEALPVVEDGHGTHIFRALPLASFHVLETLKDILDVFIVDARFMSPHEADEVLQDLRAALLGDSTPTLKKYDVGFDRGFYDRRDRGEDDE